MNKSIQSAFFISLAVLVTLLIGIVIGLISGFLSNIIYIVILFPFVMGLSAGFTLEKITVWTKIRKASLGVFLGCLMALAVYGAYHVMNYVYFRGQALFAMHQKILEETGESEPMVANAFVDYGLEEETGYSGFIGYILYKDKQGVTIGKIFGSGLNLGPFFTWVFWLLELSIIGWVTVHRARQTIASRPFCENCNRWYGKEQHLGGVSEIKAAVLIQLLENRDFAGAGAILESDAELPSLEVYTQGCGNCNSSDTWLTLKRVSFGQNGKLTFKLDLQMFIRSHEQVAMLRKLRFSAVKAS